MLIRAYAKINWTLNVLGTRPDGYHELDMLMQSVDLCDDIEICEADEITLTASGPLAHLMPQDDEKNLIMRAARLLQRETGASRGAKINICKHIPLQAGMGGGSSDAAAVMRALNDLWELGLARDELCTLGLKLGADIPYCIMGGLCRAQGLGERLTRISGAPRCGLIIAMPAAGLNTKEVFEASKAYPRQHTEEAERAIVRADWDWLDEFTANDLQPAAVKLRPEIGRCIEQMRICGARFARMTGSGSAVYGVFDKERMDEACAALSKTYTDIRIANTIVD